MPSFTDSFWESVDKNGVTTLVERMRGAKYTCEQLKQTYEARALVEEQYGKTLHQIASRQKIANTENGSCRKALNCVKSEFALIADQHLQLASHLRDNIISPLSKLINKQKAVRKQLQLSIQKIYHNRQIQIHIVRKTHRSHNLEIEKANQLVEQQETEQEKEAIYKSAEASIDRLKKLYDEAFKGLNLIVDEWNIEWRNTCETFEKLEIERLEFIKTNVSNCSQLMIGCLENEIESYERIDHSANEIHIRDDLDAFIEENKSSVIVPSSMDHIKLNAYHEKHKAMKKAKVPETELVVGKMEVYLSGEEDEYEYETETEDEEEIEPPKSVQFAPTIVHPDGIRSLQDLAKDTPSSTFTSFSSSGSIDIYNPFYSVASKEKNPLPSAQMMHDLLRTSTPPEFIDYAIALYDYGANDEGEISFRKGDLLGILSKSNEDEQGWWEASLLSANHTIVATGIVPSNFVLVKEP
ncbi:hypothetical protein BDB01DRAFT_809916 [Pilobolus umbonatus]|nr:hypothetical protein BDB01DRAFT_809916 [Pilobolus umbonatus]